MPQTAIGPLGLLGFSREKLEILQNIHVGTTILRNMQCYCSFRILHLLKLEGRCQELDQVHQLDELHRIRGHTERL